MTDKFSSTQELGNCVTSEEGRLIAKAVVDGFEPGRAPLKIVTGRQETSNLSFDLKPGAVIAHPGSSVIFVCG